MQIPEKFMLLFSKGTPSVEKILKRYANKLPSSAGILKVSKKLYKEILEVNEQLSAFGIRKNLALAHVNNRVSTGVFLKPGSKPIKKGSFIGIYTGLYELVPHDLSTHNSYSYDVAQGNRLKKNELSYITRYETPPETNVDYSIQTNAFETGNFTRFINHSSMQPNIEALISKFPDGRMEILLFALDTIKPGDQLLSNYGGHYWKALNIIPDDMAPATYTMDRSGKAVLTNPIPPLEPDLKDHLFTLRNESLEIPDALISVSAVKKYIDKIPSLKNKGLKEQVELFENIIVEKGLPRNLSLTPRKKTYELSLNLSEKPIRKGSFVGTLTGTLSLKKTKNSLLLGKTSKTSLFINPSKKGNCFQTMQTEEGGNVSMHPFHDPENGTVHLVLKAAKKISPGDTLSLIPCKPLLL